jgi:hypothetical protein
MSSWTGLTITAIWTISSTAMEEPQHECEGLESKEVGLKSIGLFSQRLIHSPERIMFVHELVRVSKPDSKLVDWDGYSFLCLACPSPQLVPRKPYREKAQKHVQQTRKDEQRRRLPDTALQPRHLVLKTVNLDLSILSSFQETSRVFSSLLQQTRKPLPASFATVESLLNPVLSSKAVLQRSRGVLEPSIGLDQNLCDRMSRGKTVLFDLM